jgi:hypothetical protein
LSIPNSKVGRVVEGGRRKGERNRREGEKERERERGAISTVQTQNFENRNYQV